MRYDNPAERLLVLLERGKQFNPTTRCRDCWEELLDAAGNTSLLMARLGTFMELPHKIVSEVRAAYTEEPDSLTLWVEQVSAAFMVQNLHADWKTFINNIDVHTLTYLRLT